MPAALCATEEGTHIFTKERKTVLHVEDRATSTSGRNHDLWRLQVEKARQAAVGQWQDHNQAGVLAEANSKKRRWPSSCMSKRGNVMPCVGAESSSWHGGGSWDGVGSSLLFCAVAHSPRERRTFAGTSIARCATTGPFLLSLLLS